jgi:hypothetical protein
MKGPQSPAGGHELPLTAEVAYFHRHRAEWIAEGRLGKWVVLKGEEVLGFFASFAEAYAAGSARFGPGPFLVKCVQEKDDVAIIKRTRPFLRAR